MLLRWLYNLCIHLVAPCALLLIAWRGMRNPAYRGRLAERLGFIESSRGPIIWVHAVSVGEVQAATPLVRALLQRYPAHPLLITTATPTGAQRVQALAGSMQGALLRHCYFPYDLPSAVRRFGWFTVDRRRCAARTTPSHASAIPRSGCPGSAGLSVVGDSKTPIRGSQSSNSGAGLRANACRR